MTTLRTPWDESTAERLAHQVFREGWSRALPPIGAVLLSGIAVQMRPSTLTELSVGLRSLSHPEPSWDVPCWEAPEHHTDESLAELNASWPDEEPDDRTAAEVNAEMDADHQAAVEKVDGYAARFGLGPVRTCRDVLGLLAAAGAVALEGETVFPTFPLPRVEDVFPVSDEERQALADMRKREEDEVA